MNVAKQIVFLQTAHPANDDRVYYHQHRTLRAAGWISDILSFYQQGKGRSEMAAACLKEVKEKLPAVILCDTPFSVLIAGRAVRKAGIKSSVVYDITEWYPSKKNLRTTPLLLRPIKAIGMSIASWLAGCRADAFLFGETYKARPFRMLFPGKRYLMLPYYPSKEYLKPTPVRKPDGRSIRLLYAGPLTQEKGWDSVQGLMQYAGTRYPDQQFELTVITQSENSGSERMPKNVVLHFKKYMPFEAFCSEVAGYDICLDLRTPDVENTRCLPIKLFYYMGAGKPVIYSALKAIRKEVPEIGEEIECSPEARLRLLIEHPDRYLQEAQRNRKLVEQKYNWEMLKQPFIDFIESLRP